MSIAQDCCQPCPTVQTVNFPGPEGADGTDGTNGANGVNAFSVTTQDFNVPNDTVTPATINMANSTWCVVGQVLIVSGPATFIVTSLLLSGTAVTALWLNAPGDLGAGSLIGAGATVSPSGAPVTIPLPIAGGGTGATTQADALAALLIQVGTATLSSGVVTVSSANITASTIILASRLDVGSGAITGFGSFTVTNITPGTPGSFDITSIDDSKATIATDNSTVNWLAVN